MSDRRERTGLAVVAGAAFAAYANSLGNGFVYDDALNVVGNRWITSLRYLPEIFANQAAGFDSAFATSYYRPLMHVIFLGTHLVAGQEPWAFHLVNVLFHVANSLMVFLVARAVLASHAGTPGAFPVPLAAALVFALHPAHTESVAWVSGVTDLSSAAFILAAVLLYFRATRREPPRFGWIALSASSLFAACLCKEVAVVFPALLPACEALRGPGASVRLRHPGRWAPYAAALGAYAAVRIAALGGLAPSARDWGLRWTDYGINAVVLLAEYLGKLVFPWPLSALHAFHPAHSLLEPRVLVSFAAVATIGGIAFVTRGDRRVAFALTLLLLPLLPALYIPSLGENVFAERYLYLPSAGFALLTALGLSRLEERRPRLRQALIVATAVLAAVYMAGTVYRNASWRDDRSLWQDATAKDPGNALAHQYLGHALYAAGRLDEAIEEYGAALRLDPSRVDAHVNLGVIYAMRGDPERAMESYRHAIRLRPGHPEAHANLGLALIQTERLDEGMAECERALALNPDLADAHHNLGLAFAAKGDLNGAIRRFEIAARLRPDNPLFRDNLARAIQLRDATR